MSALLLSPPPSPPPPEPALLPRPSIRAAGTQLRAGSAVKILDVLANRYYTGAVTGGSRDWLELELPLAGGASRLHAGQRVRFVLAEGSSPVVARREMHSATIMHVELTSGAALQIDLLPAAERAAD